ncbi:MAG TPA: hypothetical protein VER76_10790 [Pyrinomonadaceae bacterium]|nr:hypothetical protein [Pyrinomonadaceae bacterium]
MKTRDTIFTHEELIKEIRKQIKEVGTQRESPPRSSGFPSTP